MADDFESRYFGGTAVYGDDFDEEEIERWYAQEAHAYHDLVQTYESYVYSYHALNEFHGFRFLKGRYGCCLAVGCARGDEVASLASRMDKFVAIEPAEEWWAAQINGTPAEYIKPAILGDIPLASSSIDLVVCLGVLHHIPNASHVMSELSRVLRQGGQMVLREPVSTMGDWRKPRKGLTSNERGFPPGWLELQASSCGLRLLRKRYCQFPLTTRLARFLHLGPAFNNKLLVRMDSVLSDLTQWNLHYHRDSIRKKIAPGSVYLLLQK